MTTHVEPGEAVYSSDGELIGHITEIDTEGIHLIPAGKDEPTVLAGRGYGEADLVWRCGKCGEVGELDTMPDNCPNCGASREEIYYLTQD